MTQEKRRKILKLSFLLALIGLSLAEHAFAEATSEIDISSFFDQLGDFLIRTVGPGVLVIGLAVAGVSLAMGEEMGIRRGAIAAAGGALIMLSRAVLDLIQNITHF